MLYDRLKKLDIGICEFAKMLGVHRSTVFKWSLLSSATCVKIFYNLNHLPSTGKNWRALPVMLPKTNFVYVALLGLCQPILLHTAQCQPFLTWQQVFQTSLTYEIHQKTQLCLVTLHHRTAY